MTSYKGSLLALLMIISAILIAGALDKKEADKPADTYTQTESAQPVEVSTESIVEQESLIDTPTYYKEPVIIENKELLARVVFAEAGNQPYIGKLMVAATIKNRSEQWGLTPTEVVQAEGQYAKPYNIANIKTDLQRQQYTDSIKAVEEVFSNNNTYDCVMYFCNPKISNKASLRWFEDNLELVCIEGDHNFYKNKGGGR